MSGRRRGSISLGLAFAVVVAACGGAPPGGSSSAAPSIGTGDATANSRCVVGVSWADFQEWRWQAYDDPALQRAVRKLGGIYLATDGKNDPATQRSDVDDLIAHGAHVLIVENRDESAILPAVQRAIDRGIPVIAYDWFIENPKALYVAFDMVEVGRLEARHILAAAPKGRYAIFKGPAANQETDLISAGVAEVLGPAATRGDIRIVSDRNAEGWYAGKGEDDMAAVLAEQGRDLQAVIAENDNIAAGVVAALEKAGLGGTVSVSGADAEPEGLNRVARGLQTVDVWRNTQSLAAAAADAAVQLCANGGDLKRLSGTSEFTSPKKNRLTAILLEPAAVTRDNLEEPVAAAWVSKADVCADVPAAAAPPACR